MQFNFGKNWKKYLKKNYNQLRQEEANQSLLNFLGLDSMSGKIFVDIGCGSGIFSLAALKLGAAKVISTDINPEAIVCANELWKKNSCSTNWQIRQGSLLDRNFIISLGRADIIYCWGVAHHTGNMWQALENLTVNLIAGDMLFIAIYNKVGGIFSSTRWEKIKKFYNKTNKTNKKIMEYLYAALIFFRLIIGLHNPLRVIKKYTGRGMSWRTDLIDWLGGYPYEYASAKEIFDFFHNKYDMELINMKITNYSGCNQFLFIKK